VKTIPLIPVWVVMQLELAGLIPNGLASHPAERDHLRAVPAEPDAPQPTQ
jgi:hypothetical protein